MVGYKKREEGLAFIFDESVPERYIKGEVDILPIWFAAVIAAFGLVFYFGR